MKISKLLVLFTFLLIVKNSSAVNLYGAASLNFGAVVSDSEFYNGAGGTAPGLTFGARFQKISFEIFYRKYSLSNDHTVAPTDFHLDIDNTVVGAGMRFNFSPFLNWTLGYSMQEVSTTATASNSNVGLGSLVNEKLGGFYLAGGFNIPAYLENLEFYSDIIYFRSTARYSQFSLDFGLRYAFFSL